MDLAEKIKEVKELIKSLLLLGKFEIFPAFDDTYDLIVENSVRVRTSLNHFTKEINYPNRAFSNEFFDVSSLTRDEKAIVYHFVINGGVKVMLQNKKQQIETMKKEVENLELLLKTQPINES